MPGVGRVVAGMQGVESLIRRQIGDDRLSNRGSCRIDQAKARLRKVARVPVFSPDARLWV